MNKVRHKREISQQISMKSREYVGHSLVKHDLESLEETGKI